MMPCLLVSQRDSIKKALTTPKLLNKFDVITMPYFTFQFFVATPYSALHGAVASVALHFEVMVLASHCVSVTLHCEVMALALHYTAR